MTTKRDIIRAGFDSLNANSSGNPDVDRDLGIAQPEDFLPITELIDGDIEAKQVAKRRHPAGIPHPQAYSGGRVRGDTEHDGGSAPVGHEPYKETKPNRDDIVRGRMALRLIKDK